MAAMSWKHIKKAIVQKCWMNPWSSIVFYDDCSIEEEFSGFNVRPKYITDIQRRIKSIPGNNTVAKLTKSILNEARYGQRQTSFRNFESVRNPQKP